MVIGDCRLGLWGGHCCTGRPRWGPGKLMELVGELFAKWRLESEAETGAQELGGVCTRPAAGPRAWTAAGASLWGHKACARPRRASSLQRLGWNLGVRRRGHGLREGCALLDLVNPMGEVADIGEDAGVGGMSAVQAPAGQPHQNP